MNVLFIGDVVADPGCEMVRKWLCKIKKENKVDVVIANGENSANGNGISISSSKHLFDSGVDIITGGNHTLKRKEIYPILDESKFILRPANMFSLCPGKGVCEYDLGKHKLVVINLLGQVFTQPCNSPFETIDKILKEVKSKFIVVDFHAEATGEKGALAYYLDGRVSAVLGTHTHVQTNDAKILKNGTGFISDVGMVGPYDSILGVNPNEVITKLTTQTSVYFCVKDSPCIFNSVLLELDDISGLCNNITTINI